MPEEKEKTRKATIATCGHVNKHFVSAVDPVTGKVLNGDEMVCDLERGHAGDHEANYVTLSGGLVVKKRAYWSDAAGKSPE